MRQLYSKLEHDGVLTVHDVDTSEELALIYPPDHFDNDSGDYALWVGPEFLGHFSDEGEAWSIAERYYELNGQVTTPVVTWGQDTNNGDKK